MGKFKWKKETEDYCAYYGDEELGYIEYYDKWKKWVWNQGENIILAENCTKEVYLKLKELRESERNGN